jgi:hypothetical protein
LQAMVICEVIAAGWLPGAHQRHNCRGIRMWSATVPVKGWVRECFVNER